MEEYKAKGVSRFAMQKHQFLAAFVASIGSFGLGNVFGWTSPALPNLMIGQEFGIITLAESSWIASLAILGALLSGPISGLLINRIGRKKLMLFMALPFTIGWCLIAGANNLAMICVGRFMTGFAGGSFTVTIPVYITEIAEDNIRGTLGSFMVLSIVTGMLFTYTFGTIVSWAGLSIICTAIPILFFCLMIFMPETPRYLLTKGKVIEARNSLIWLRGNVDHRQVDLTLTKLKTEFLIQDKLTTSTENIPYWNQLFVSSSLFVFQQFSGINGITLFTVDIFRSAGSPLSPNIASILIGIVQVLFVLVSLIIVDKVGRKSLLLTSDMIMASSLLALGIFYYFKEQNNGQVLNFLVCIPLVSLVTFVIAYSVGAGPIPWLLVGELLPARAQGIGSSIVTSFYWILAFFSTLTFKDHFYYYWIFSGISFGGAIFTYFLVPETKGKTQEEIQRCFNSSIEYGRTIGKGSESDTEKRNILTANHSNCDCDSMVDLDNNVKADLV